MFNVYEYNKTWRKNNPDKAREHYRKYRDKNRGKRNQYFKERYINILKSWEGLIPKETQCQICGKKIYFNRNNGKDAIYFDHRHKDTPIKVKPSTWLIRNKRTPESEKLWKKSDFGMLCNKCNIILPTENRKEFLEKFMKYIEDSYTVDK